MQKTKIEWVRNQDGSQGYTVNPVKGYCPMACPYCYARRMYDRFGWDKAIRFERIELLKATSFLATKSPCRVFIGSTFELFGEWVKTIWIQEILAFVRALPQHTFIFLTKQPQNLIKWSPFPENCYIGVSVCNDKMLDVAVSKLEDIQATVKFISFEPLLERLTLSLDYAFYYSGISWLIIGSETGNRKGKTPLEQVQGWAREIIRAADEAGIPVFCKNNLKLENPRQEFPLQSAKNMGRTRGPKNNLTKHARGLGTHPKQSKEGGGRSHDT